MFYIHRIIIYKRSGLGFVIPHDLPDGTFILFDLVVIGSSG